MSYILKALKKLEEDKAARLTNQHDINRAILTPERSTGSGPRTILKWAAGPVLFIAGCCLAYVLLHGKAATYLPTGNIAPSPDERQMQSNRPPPASPGTSPADAVTGTIPAPANLPPAGDRSAPASMDRTPEVVVNPASRQPVTDPSPRIGSTGTEHAGPAPAGIVVNGIALQDDPSESVAVVNGILARRGTTVQGMRIEEILSDRVRFSGNGEKFEVRISK